jgi:hypothetical protein
MMLFILYIEPLLKKQDIETEGLQEFVKSMAYADHVWFVSKKEHDSSLAFRVEFLRKIWYIASYQQIIVHATTVI